MPLPQDESGKTQCKNLTLCGSGKFVTTNPTLTSNRVCGTCLTAQNCSTNQFLTGLCGGSFSTSCASCDPTCASCSGSNNTQCLSCVGSLSLLNGTCVSSCSAGLFGSSGTCTACDSVCKTCSGAGATACLSCSNTTALFNKTCLVTCPAGYFKAPSADGGLVCQACSVCPYGSFASANCTQVNNTVCSSWTTCNAGYEPANEPSPYVNRVCQVCNLTRFYQVGIYVCYVCVCLCVCVCVCDICILCLCVLFVYCFYACLHLILCLAGTHM